MPFALHAELVVGLEREEGERHAGVVRSRISGCIVLTFVFYEVLNAIGKW